MTKDPNMKTPNFEDFMVLLGKTRGTLDFKKLDDVGIKIHLGKAMISVNGENLKEAMENLNSAINDLPKECKELNDQMKLF